MLLVVSWNLIGIDCKLWELFGNCDNTQDLFSCITVCVVLKPGSLLLSFWVDCRTCCHGGVVAHICERECSSYSVLVGLVMGINERAGWVWWG